MDYATKKSKLCLNLVVAAFFMLPVQSPHAEPAIPPKVELPLTYLQTLLDRARLLLDLSNPKRDPIMAAAILEQCVAVDDGGAMLQLAELYRLGDGVPKNIVKAKALLAKAADQSTLEPPSFIQSKAQPLLAKIAKQPALKPLSVLSRKYDSPKKDIRDRESVVIDPTEPALTQPRVLPRMTPKKVATKKLERSLPSALARWRVLDVRDGIAVVDGLERGVFMIQLGSRIPGIGVVQSISEQGGARTVITSGGAIGP